MPRLRNAVTGVAVSVSDDTATRLGREWQPVEATPARPRRRAPRRAEAPATEKE